MAAPITESPMVAARKARGLTQEQLADKLGVDQSYISRLERGDATPSVPVARKLIAELGITLDDLVPAERGAAEGA